MGAVSYLQNWFAWERDDAHRGKDAAAVFRQAYSLTVDDAINGVGCDCEETDNADEPVTEEEVRSWGGATIIWEETDMNLCTVNSRAFEIRNGSELWVNDHCDGWVKIGSFVPESEQPPDDYTPTTEQYYKCGKIWSLIDAFVALSDAAWSGYENPHTLEALMRGAVPNATLSRARIYQWPANLVLLDAIYNASHFNNPEMLELAACLALDQVQSTKDATLDEVNAVVTSLASACSTTWGPSIQVEGWKSYWAFVQETIGDNDCKFIMSLGSTDDTAVCSCGGGGDVAFWEDEEDWYIVYSFQGVLPPYWTLGTSNGNNVVTPQGVTVEADTPGSELVHLRWTPPVTAGVTIKRAKLEMLMSDAWVASGPFVSTGINIDGIGAYLEGALLVGTSGIYTIESTTMGVSPVDWDIYLESDAPWTFSPPMPIVARVILAGSGPHPLGL